MDANPSHCAIYFQGSWLPLSFSGTWSGTMSKVYIISPELKDSCAYDV